MKFLVDAQLPRLLAVRLNELGQNARHTLDLPAGNRTTDRAITEWADLQAAVVITKDADFLNSHLLAGQPARLLLVATGNIPNRNLIGLFEIHLVRILAALQSSAFVELSHTGLTLHD
jgi:predicted nuclease of predicted toxin-antitoxin system